MNRLVVLLIAVVVLSWAGAAQAQYVQTCCYAPTVTYYQPATVYYAAAPTWTYYAPAPLVTTRYRPILGGTVTRVHYGWARPWAAYYPGCCW